MLSEEEKKALEQLNKRYEFFKENPLATNVWLSLDVYNLGTILNLIEKQSKEIEELKENNKELKTQIEEHVYYDLGGRSCGKTELLRHYKKGYDMNNKFWKDKIKAKIEEYKKEIDKLYKKKNWYEPQDTEKKNKYMHYIEFGQSLLEKE